MWISNSFSQRPCRVRAFSLLRSLQWLGLLFAVVAGPALAGEPAVGMALYNNIPDSVISCGNASCHGPNPDNNVNGLQVAANNPGVIQTAIRKGVTQMMFLNGLLSPFQLDDIASYLAPQPSLSDAGLDFPVQTVGTMGATQAAILSSIGGVNLAVTAITVAGPNAADFVIGGTCAAGASLASTTIEQSGGSCTVTAAFAPTAAGPRSAAVTLAYGGLATFPAVQTILLSGMATVPLAPAASISPTYIDFGEIEITATAPAREVVVANTGNAPLHVSGLVLGGPHPGEFHLQGSCMATAPPFAIAANGSCTIAIEFIAAGADLRNAELVVTHDAPGSPGRIALTGVGVAPVCAPPPPNRQFQVLSCPAGEQGSLTQARDAVCQGTQWEYGPWTTIADTCAAFPPAGLELVEYYNSDLNHYFITADPAERQSVETGGAGPGWIRKATLGRVWPAAAAAALSPVCRFYGNRALGPDGGPLGPNSHFYTIDTDECTAVKGDPGWRFEGLVFDAVIPQLGRCPVPLVPVYRNYNGRFAENDSNHRYSTDPATVQQMALLGWPPEGIVLCVAPF